ncbi:endonuclease V [Natronosalvus halobius]|uniref:endonuclease V n=1 Tax=Natronosalvus halobius TaxID=2953746 RepID=UPI00209DA5CE|nr:endonuclease V [Natronosalvus halobius]USZ72733.1 endonuclease V [Natronosalvus halobius]
MTRIHRPDLVPDPALSRADMEAMQHEIAREAVFEDDFAFDLEALTNPLAATSTSSVGGSDSESESECDGNRDTESITQPIVAGVDQSFLLDSEPERALSAIVVTQGEEVLERVFAVTPLEIPYVPGLLSFREGGPILEAVETLTTDPDVFLFDGSGRIHFREAGIATHMGVVLDAPSVGVAKSLLCGEATGDLENLAAGTRVPIESNARVETDPGTLLGYAVQTKQYDSPNRYVNPLYVSPGHRVGPESAADLALALSTGYKLPEPVRLADSYADEAKGELD